jgi:signal transduction histidine kinase
MAGLRATARFTLLYATGVLGSGVLLLLLTYALSGGGVTVPATGPVPPPDPGLQSRQLLAGALLALTLLAGASLVIGRLLARRVLRPLRTITAATRRISADSLDRRLAVTGPADEVKDLADTIDGLLQRLETSFTAQRRFAANASHELRTPFATMRAALDVAAAKPSAAVSTLALADRLRPQLDRVDHLLDGLLALARAQHGAWADAEPVDLVALVRAALPADGPAVTVDLPVALHVPGSPPLLSRLVANVIDNAVTHNEPGGWIRITASGPALIVENGGPRLDQRQVDRLTRPFERLGPDRTGSSGLGLSIVAAIAEAHGGHVALHARPEGGLQVTITLPRR